MFFMTRFFGFAVLLAGLVLAAPAQADEASALESFKQGFIAATNGTDAAAFTALEYPNPAAGEEKYQDYLAWQVQKDLKMKLPADATFALEPLESGGMFKAMGFVYPVEPTHKLQIDYKRDEYSSGMAVREMYYDAEKDAFLFITPLPGEDMLKQMNQKPQ